VVVLKADEVLAHVVRRPGVIAGESSNVVEVWAVRVHSDQSIVGSAASQSTGARVKSTLHLRPGRRVETSVETAIRSLVAGLEVSGLSLLVSIVLDVEVPSKAGILWDFGVVGRDGVVDVGALVVSSLDQQSLVASEGKASGKRTVRWLEMKRANQCGWQYVPSTSTRSNNDIFVASEINSSSECGEGCKRADHLLETHNWKRRTNGQRLFERLPAWRRHCTVKLQDNALILAASLPYRATPGGEHGSLLVNWDHALHSPKEDDGRHPASNYSTWSATIGHRRALSGRQGGLWPDPPSSRQQSCKSIDVHVKALATERGSVNKDYMKFKSPRLFASKKHGCVYSLNVDHETLTILTLL
jgi:hypothetical protein